MPKTAKKKLVKRTAAPKLKLRKRLDRKSALASLQKRHAEMDRQGQIMRDNKRISRAVLARVFSR